MIRIIVTGLLLGTGLALAGCATTGGTVTVSSATPAVLGVAPFNQPRAPYRVFPGDEEHGTPQQGDSLH